VTAARYKQRKQAGTSAAGGEYEFIQKVKITNPSLWVAGQSISSQVRSTVIKQGKATDIYDTVFGVRSIEFDKDKGFLLNGRQVKLHGVCCITRPAPVGAAVPERVWERRPGKIERDGLQRHPDIAQSLFSGIHGFVRQNGFLVMAEIYDEMKEPKPQTPDFGYRNLL